MFSSTPYTPPHFYVWKCNLHSHCSLTVLGPNKPLLTWASVNRFLSHCARSQLLARLSLRLTSWLLLMSLKTFNSPVLTPVLYNRLTCPHHTTLDQCNFFFCYLGKLPNVGVCATQCTACILATLWILSNAFITSVINSLSNLNNKCLWF